MRREERVGKMMEGWGAGVAYWREEQSVLRTLLSSPSSPSLTLSVSQVSRATTPGLGGTRGTDLKMLILLVVKAAAVLVLIVLVQLLVLVLCLC